MSSNNTNEESYSMRSPAVKRILREAKELKEATYDYYACPLEDNIFEWHFTVRGASDTDFAGGLYHGRIILPNEYPMKPPSILLLTQNGRFEVNKKICLSISGYHPETWMPSWSIRTVLMAIISFMPTKSEGAIGSLDYTPAERQKLAKRSHRFACATCGEIKHHLKETPEADREQTNQVNLDNKELQNFIMNVSFKGESSSQQNKSNTDKLESFQPQEQTSNEPELSGKIGEQTKDVESMADIETSQESQSNTNVETAAQEQTEAVIQNNRLDGLFGGPIGNMLLCSILAIIVALLFRRLIAYL